MPTKPVAGDHGRCVHCGQDIVQRIDYLKRAIWLHTTTRMSHCSLTELKACRSVCRHDRATPVVGVTILEEE